MNESSLGSVHIDVEHQLELTQCSGHTEHECARAIWKISKRRNGAAVGKQYTNEFKRTALSSITADIGHEL